jgi:phage tail sheath protein FI
VYVEETSFRAKSIEGVSTSTAGFVGPAGFGPTGGVPELLTSFADFERIYGSLDQLQFDSEDLRDNYLAHAVRAFFNEGGQRLYVSRAYKALVDPYPPTTDNPARLTAGNWSDGHARETIPRNADGSSPYLSLRARYPGSYGNMTVTLTARVGPNVLAGVPVDPANPLGDKVPVLRGVNPYDLVWIKDQGSPMASPPGGGTLYWAERRFDNVSRRVTWTFHGAPGVADLELDALVPGSGNDEVHVVTVSVLVTYPGTFPRTDAWQNLTFHPAHSVSLSQVFAAELASRTQALHVPLVFAPSAAMEGPQIAQILLGQDRPDLERRRIESFLYPLTYPDRPDVSTILASLAISQLGDADRQFSVTLESGNDGKRPKPQGYEGDDTDPANKTGLKAFEDIADISIVAAPGSSFESKPGEPQQDADARQITGDVISHCERMRYRIGVLDAPNAQGLSEVTAYRAQVDSKHAALYYPWVRIMDPITQQEINLPPSGFVTGIYARNDAEKGVHKAPANEVVRGAIDFEVRLNKAQQDILNPAGINCFRFFEGRGFRLWGARTISSDPEWKYVNLRRYFAYLERSIDVGTQFAVFENNNEALWSNMRRTIEDFLYNEWKSGHLMGMKPEEAFFVRCDRSTMTQNDLDNGRLVCLIGVAAVRPAEFVIFRIGQWTADHHS